MTYTKKQFIEDVKKEARAIKEHATDFELTKLDFESFKANDPHECIYGQMTGHCTSKRAHQLIAQCCPRMVDNEKFNTDDDFESIANAINGKVRSIKELSEKRDSTGYALEYVSAIEAYIMSDNANNANLIAYLKGERNDLVL